MLAYPVIAITSLSIIGCFINIYNRRNGQMITSIEELGKDDKHDLRSMAYALKGCGIGLISLVAGTVYNTLETFMGNSVDKDGNPIKKWI